MVEGNCLVLSNIKFSFEDTWTKSRGRVEVGLAGVGVEGWGENADNYN